jgi:hypothetical protein
MAARSRTPDDVRRDIERERDQLVTAVAQLRGDLRSVANVKPLLRKAAVAVVAVVAIRFVVRRFSGARRRSG